MKALIIAAHGSRKKEAAAEVAALAERLAEKTGPEFDMVSHGFLQFARPLLGDVIDDLAAKGADKIVVFPFFIAAGSHILKDIPELIQKARDTHEGMDISITPHLGACESIEELILKQVGIHGVKYPD